MCGGHGHRRPGQACQWPPHPHSPSVALYSGTHTLLLFPSQLLILCPHSQQHMTVSDACSPTQMVHSSENDTRPHPSPTRTATRVPRKGEGGLKKYLPPTRRGSETERFLLGAGEHFGGLSGTRMKTPILK